MTTIMSGRRRDLKIYTEPIKGHYTSHWDLDYLPSDAVDSLYGSSRAEPSVNTPNWFVLVWTSIKNSLRVFQR